MISIRLYIDHMPIMKANPDRACSILRDVQVL